MSLRAFNVLTPLIVALWALSPLGGQAALRVVKEGPSSHDWPFWYLNIHNNLSYLGTQAVLPSAELGLVVAAFSAALASPLHTKTAPQDVFGHVKIPMIEPFLASDTTDEKGWYEVGQVGNTTEIVYSSLAGLPTTPDSGFESQSNYTFQLQTLFMSTKCDLSKRTQMQRPDWEEYVERPFKKASQIRNSTYTNNRTLLIEDPPRKFYKNPRRLIFTSYTPGTITNATCQVRTPFVQLEIACHRATCSATQVPAFLSTLVNASLAYWDPSPIELYFLKPDSPFYYSYENPPIWNVGEEVFSQRFSQLLNTFWIVSVAPFDALNNLTLQERQMRNTDLSQLSPDYLKTNGTRTTDILVLKVDGAWLGILVIASLSMLLAALAAAVLNALRRGPDMLGHLTYLIRDSPYMDGIEAHKSMEDGIDYTRRLKNLQIFLGDVKAGQERGYIAIGTLDKAVPMERQKYEAIVLPSGDALSGIQCLAA
ncbi:hypothetical protein QQZ08_001792 [Neonectria magnoliae]|uniref:Uncharacterized protein n=1 Tax=Neonectria magnoliae TaxID=2732573 RepID=A0ABR1IDE1_9HYPO